jgi:hypothetical protein
MIHLPCCAETSRLSIWIQLTYEFKSKKLISSTKITSFSYIFCKLIIFSSLFYNINFFIIKYHQIDLIFILTWESLFFLDSLGFTFHKNFNPINPFCVFCRNLTIIWISVSGSCGYSLFRQTMIQLSMTNRS